MPEGSLRLPEPQSWVGWLQALQQRPPASAAGSQSSGQVCTVQTPPAWSLGHWREAHTSGRAGPGHSQRGK